MPTNSKRCSKNSSSAPLSLVAAVCLLLCGCGGYVVVPVRGVVYVDDRPAGPGMVIFQPVRTGSTPIPSAMGRINEAGEFVLTTFHADDGAVVGEHVVIVQGGEDIGTELVEEKAASNIPLLYADPSASGLKANVPPAGGVIELKLTSPQ